jgi:hypothetical protein
MEPHTHGGTDAPECTTCNTRRLVPVEIRPITAPDGMRGVLIQLEHGWTIVNPTDAKRIGFTLIETATEVEKT